jgi:SAM-dependent methyltransferase
MPTWALSLARPAYHAAFRVGLSLQCLYLDLFTPRKVAVGGTYEPVPPALLRFRVSETASLSVFLTVGERTAHDIIANLATLGMPLEGCGTVLDFGCGCGRTLRWLTKASPKTRFHGADVDAEAIAWCRDHLPGAEFRVSPAAPPTDYADASFDLIYAISVFTHLSLKHQLLWFAELHRILKPEGLLFFTVHGERAWQPLSADKIERLQREGFLFETSPKLRGIVPDWYHTAFHSESGVRRILSETFRVLAYNPAGMGYQDVVVAQRLDR